MVGGKTSAEQSAKRILSYDEATRSGVLKDWEKFFDDYVWDGGPDVAKAGREIERLLFERVNVARDLAACEEYQKREEYLIKDKGLTYWDGKVLRPRYWDRAHSEQVKAIKEPILFASAKEAKTAEVYKQFLNEYPQGEYSSKIRVLLDPVLFAFASKADWHTEYKDYLHFCSECSNAPAVRERLAFLEANPAEPDISFPTVVTAGHGVAEWTTVLREHGGVVGYKLEGHGLMISASGDKYAHASGDILRGLLVVPKGGVAKDGYFVQGFCGGRAEFQWYGEDAGGHHIHLYEKISISCP
jgi:hypothetical protein